MAKILADCRDIAVHRLLLSFNSTLERVGEMLMERASRTDVREEQALCLDARDTLQQSRPDLMAEFERRLRSQVDDRIAGKVTAKADFSRMEGDKLTLVDTHAMDESVLTGNITRVVENLCHDELQLLNRGIGHLLGQPELETDRNPFAPATIVEAFADALQSINAEPGVKHTILKELNRASLTEINSIYADLNKHLQNLHVMPAGLSRPSPIRRRGAPNRAKDHAAADGEAPSASSDVDLMEMFRRRLAVGAAPGGASAAPGAVMFGGSSGTPGPGGVGVYRAAPVGDGGEGYPAIGAESGARYIPTGPMAPTPSGYIPGAPIMATPMLGEGLARLQSGETGFDLGGGTIVQFSGIPTGQHNVLRDLQDSPLGKKVNQLESMTIELVAMLFDFIFETKDLPDGIKGCWPACTAPRR